MGTAEIELQNIIIYSHIITYGHAANPQITEQIREEIETMRNEPRAVVPIEEKNYRVVFNISAACMTQLADIDIYQNLDPRNNYFRLEEFVRGNISFVDGLGCNTGYFKLANLMNNSTTAAHEFGHTLGLDHPQVLDIRGSGTPGIMYPRGTLVDPRFQYDPAIAAGLKGGTLNPVTRKVQQQDVDLLHLDKLKFSQEGKAVVGGFTSVWHHKHLPGA